MSKFKNIMEGIVLILVLIVIIANATMCSLMNTYCEGEQCPDYIGDMKSIDRGDEE